MPFGLKKKKAQVTVDRQRQVDICYAVKQLARGDLKFISGIDSKSAFVLSFQNVKLAEPRLSQANLEAGIKERITKGLYFYVAQSQDTNPTEELIQIDIGTMTIGANGVDFAGKSKHISMNFGDIDSIGHTDNGISISARSQLKRVRFEGADGAIVTLKVHDRTYKQTLSGKLMRLLVEAAMKRSLEKRN